MLSGSSPTGKERPFCKTQHENIDLRKIKDGLNLLKVFSQTLRCDVNHLKDLQKGYIYSSTHNGNVKLA